MVVDLARFLRTAEGAADALTRLHDDGLLHLNLRPENIVVLSGGQVELRGAARETAEAATSAGGQPRRLVAEALPYMAPEQTGRLNLAVDPRTDLYSLGVSLYEMLAVRLPFQADDLLGWVHGHIARPPAPLAEVAPEVPEVVAAIVMKLLAKAPEDRYQSARGLRRDLARCLASLSSGGTIPAFPLGTDDRTGHLRIPTRLYGRDREVASLLGAFEATLASAAPAMALITGQAGTGKSSVVRELLRPIARERGFFLSGKFEQHRREIPYLTIGQAFRQLVRQVLSERDAWLVPFRERLLDALGASAGLVIELIPELSLVLGAQPHAVPLPSTEAQRRLQEAFRCFVSAVAQREHPLVLFLDDLQWADLASLDLLAHLVTHPDVAYFLVIGAYRDNEVSDAHPLAATLDRIGRTPVKMLSLDLAPLGPRDLERLVLDTFRCDDAEAAPLAALLHDKTGGNPFFATQLLAMLGRERLVEFDAARGAWRWDLAEIKARGITEDVVAFMVGKLERLPAETRSAITTAAFVGSEFDAATLATVCGGALETREDIERALAPAVAEGLLLRSEQRYRFLHDRVEQAAYSLVPEGDRSAVHLKVGRLLLERTPEAELPGRIFDIANHLNAGASLISSASERRLAAELNLDAGLMAKAKAAFGSAARYLSAGLALLGEGAWDDGYELSYKLHIELAECEYVVGRLDASDRLCGVVLARARTAVDRAAAYCLRISIEAAKGNNARGVELCIECLRQLPVVGFGAEGAERRPGAPNVELRFGAEGAERRPGAPDAELATTSLPREASRVDLERALAEIRALLAGRSIAELVDLPRMSDPAVIAAIKTLAAAHLVSFHTEDRDLTGLLICTIVRLSILHGNAEASVMGYASLGELLCGQRGEYEDGYSFGKLAYDLAEKHGFIAFKTQACNYLGSMISIWKRHISTNVELCRIGFQAAQETGNVPYGFFHVLQLSAALLVRGDPLPEVAAAARAAIDHARSAQFLPMIEKPLSIVGFVRSMRGAELSAERPGAAPSPEDDDRIEALEARLRASASPVVSAWGYVMLLMTRYMAGDHEGALRAAERAKEKLYSIASMVLCAEYFFFTALAAAARAPRVDAASRRELTALVASHREKLALWAAQCPDNYAGKHALVSAELCRIEGRSATEVAALYDRAIEAFRASRFVHNEGLANELAAGFYEGLGMPSMARACLREALSCYARWGAHRRIRRIEEERAELLGDAPRAEANGGVNAEIEKLDAMAVVRAARALSGEIVMQRLLSTLMDLALAHAGAERCCLLLPRGANDVIAAEARALAQGIEVRVPDPPPPASSVEAPMTIVAYAKRARERVMLEDAAADPAFGMDEYIARERPRSVLCMNIPGRAGSAGVLYLEHRRVPGAFTRRHAESLELIGAQAAISLENAALYAELEASNLRLERQVQERTRELRSAKEAADAANKAKSDFLASMSHELRTPLNGVLGYAQILERSPAVAEEERDRVRIIRRSAEHLLTLINDVLDLARIEAGRLEIAPRDAHFPTLIRTVSDICRVRAEQKGLAFTQRHVGRELDRVIVDDRRLVQILLNLLGNAIKFTERGGVTLGVEVADGGRAGDLAVRFRIEDTGPGIAALHLGRIFEAFERVGDRRGQVEGTGLGLSITRKLVEQLGGTIDVESRVGEGTVFTVKLSVRESTADAEGEDRSWQAITGYEGERRVLLLVDDVDDNRAVARDLLAPLGFEVLEAESGEAALELAAARPPSLVLLDLALPGMDGYQVARRLRRDPALSKAAILASSASISSDEPERSVRAGCDAFLPKPLEARALFAALERSLGLVWIRGDERCVESVRGRRDDATAPRPKAPPADELASLLDLVEQGRLRPLRQRLRQLAEGDPALTPWVDRVRTLADGFQLEQLQALLVAHGASVRGDAGRSLAGTKDSGP